MLLGDGRTVAQPGRDDVDWEALDQLGLTTRTQVLEDPSPRFNASPTDDPQRLFTQVTALWAVNGEPPACMIDVPPSQALNLRRDAEPTVTGQREDQAPLVIRTGGDNGIKRNLIDEHPALLVGHILDGQTVEWIGLDVAVVNSGGEELFRTLASAANRGLRLSFTQQEDSAGRCRPETPPGRLWPVTCFHASWASRRYAYPGTLQSTPRL